MITINVMIRLVLFLRVSVSWASLGGAESMRFTNCGAGADCAIGAKIISYIIPCFCPLLYFLNYKGPQTPTLIVN